jgi:hypothetical protein
MTLTLFEDRQQNITPEQTQVLRDLIKQAGVDEAKVCNSMRPKISKLEDLPAHKYPSLIDRLLGKTGTPVERPEPEEYATEIPQ